MGEAIGGTYVKNPWWTNSYFGNHLITAHPMGDCTTANNVVGGVVDHADPGVPPRRRHLRRTVSHRRLRQFHARSGVNPFLTISMFTERVAEQLRAELELPALVTGGEGDDL